MRLRSLSKSPSVGVGDEFISQSPQEVAYLKGMLDKMDKRKAGEIGVGALSTSLDELTQDTRDAWEKLLPILEAHGLKVKVRSTKRSCAEQNEQYGIGRQPGDTRQIVTHARGCQSWHVLGRAIDVDIISSPADYEKFGKLAKTQQFKWGGDFPGFKDSGHIEFHPNMTIEQVCPNPDDCGDVAENIPKSSKGIGTGTKVLLAGGIGLGVWLLARSVS